MSDNKDFLLRLANAKVHHIYHRGGPSITKGGRLSSVSEGHYGEYFEIDGYRDIEGRFIIKVTYLPYIKCGSLWHCRKAGTAVSCGAFHIKDICEKYLGPEPDDGWHFNLLEIQRDDSKHSVKYVVLE